MVTRFTELPPKLSRPSAVGLLARDRLFEMLDRFRRRPITWVQGPPGAGKTSLVSSWIEARGLAHLWYQIDGGDADPATFFHYLREGAPGGTPPLPALTPEYLPDAPGFARRFFRALAARVGSPAVLVLDNFQEVSEEAPLAMLVREGCRELPDGVTLLILSRTNPPTAYAEAIAHADLARIRWDDLRLNVEETLRLAGLDDVGGRDRARTLHERSGGWAAGVRLALESADAAVPATLAEAPEPVFVYLATEVFDRSPPELQSLWLETAYLPRFTAAMATALSRRDDTAARLEDLVSRRYFLERGTGAATFQYHALFGEFLRRQVERHLGEAQRLRLTQRSAALLAAAGEPEAAFRLYCAGGDFESAIPLILREAPGLLAQGRWQTLQNALTALPEALLGEGPWLLFWLGAAQGMTHPPSGRATIERAHARFVAAGDRVGEAMSVAAIIESYFAEWDHLAKVGAWIDAAERLIETDLRFPAPPAELRFWSSLLMALTHARPASPLAAVAAERTFALLELDLGVNERLAAGSHALHFLAIAGDLRRSISLAASIVPHLEATDVTPLVRLSVHWGLTMQAHFANDVAGALRANLEAQRIIRDNGFGFAEAVTRLFEVWTRISAGEIDAAATTLDEIEPVVARARPNERALEQFLRAWIGLHRRDWHGALRHGELAVQTVTGRETYGPAVFSHGAVALAAVACGDVERADRAVAHIRTWTRGLNRGSVFIFAEIVEAEVRLRSGRRDEGREALRRALACGNGTDGGGSVVWLPDLMARLCAEALQAGIETEFASRLITSRGLRAPAPEVEGWPWPIRIRALGPFEVEVNGEVLRFARKAQRRVLDLLKCVVALGPDGVSRAAVSAALWPDAEGDAASQSFDVTLHRLRKLLGRDDALLLSQSMLHVDPSIVWVDATAFERLADRANGAHGDLDAETAARALTLYRGPFMGKEEEVAWLLPARERLRSRYTRLARRAAQHAEARGDAAQATDICRAALEVEPLAEELHRRLMLALAAQGRHAEALDAYRRCRHVLETVLGAAPSPETQAVHATIGRAA